MLVFVESNTILGSDLCQPVNRKCVPTISAGVSLLNNLRVQCESGFGSGVLAHVMLSGSDSDKMSCALSLPLISR